MWRSTLLFAFPMVALCGSALGFAAHAGFLSHGRQVAHVSDGAADVQVLMGAVADKAAPLVGAPSSTFAAPAEGAARFAGAFDMYGFSAFDGTAVLLSEEQRDERVKRLQEGPVRTLHHQTTMQACRGIVANGFRVGTHGIAGPGIYFAERRGMTAFKAEHFGCMIVAKVRVGKTKKVGWHGDRRISGAKLLRAGYDSVWMPRGWPVGTAPEWVVYFKDQIENITTYPCNRDGSHRRR